MRFTSPTWKNGSAHPQRSTVIKLNPQGVSVSMAMPPQNIQNSASTVSRRRELDRPESFNRLRRQGYRQPYSASAARTPGSIFTI